ncbi:hypothetical protein [uncultured Clostridium sp.]|uniref:hypothetical protein n=1 Tax=uncultured Clostridium sp. TaxID=59620 RepID=UPI0028EF2A90|nr:hypothetical protein [uncultured Clostridium sp.]
MALKEEGDLISKNVVLDKNDLSSFERLKESNKELNKKSSKNKYITNVSHLIRDAMKKYLEPSEYSALERYTKKELRNYFTVEEASLITASFNGSSYDVNTISPKIVLVNTIKDNIDLDKFDELYNVNGESLMKKLNNLSEFQCYVVIKMTYTFWSTSEDINNDAIDNIKKIFLIN